MRNNGYDPKKVFNQEEYNHALATGIVAGTIENFAMQLINNGIKKELVKEAMLPYQSVMKKVFTETSRAVGWETVANAFEMGFQSYHEQSNTKKGINWEEVFNATALGGLQGGLGAGIVTGVHKSAFRKSTIDKRKKNIMKLIKMMNF